MQLSVITDFLLLFKKIEDDSSLFFKKIEDGSLYFCVSLKFVAHS